MARLWIACDQLQEGVAIAVAAPQEIAQHRIDETLGARKFRFRRRRMHGLIDDRKRRIGKRGWHVARSGRLAERIDQERDRHDQQFAQQRRFGHAAGKFGQQGIGAAAPSQSSIRDVANRAGGIGPAGERRGQSGKFGKQCLAQRGTSAHRAASARSAEHREGERVMWKIGPRGSMLHDPIVASATDVGPTQTDARSQGVEKRSEDGWLQGAPHLSTAAGTGCTLCT